MDDNFLRESSATDEILDETGAVYEISDHTDELFQCQQVFIDADPISIDAGWAAEGIGLSYVLRQQPDEAKGWIKLGNSILSVAAEVDAITNKFTDTHNTDV